MPLRRVALFVLRFSGERSSPIIVFKAKVNLTLGGLNNGGLHESSDEDCLLLNIYVPDTETRFYNFF